MRYTHTTNFFLKKNKRYNKYKKATENVQLIVNPKPKLTFFEINKTNKQKRRQK